MVYRGPGMSALRHPNAVALRPMMEHTELHDLSGANPNELRLLHLLMRLVGNPVGYERSGITSILYPNIASDIDQLRAHGYLLEPLPLDLLMTKVTVPDIKELLRAHSLPLGGKRADLVERVTPVLTADEIAALRNRFAFWLPSDYGYEMLYSYYTLWEQREWALANAIVNNSVPQITAAMEALQNCYPKRDGMCLDVTHIRRAMQTIGGRRPVDEIECRALFEVIAGFKPTFWLHNVNWTIKE